MPGIVRPVAAAIIRHYHRLIFDREYRKLQLMAFRFQFKARYSAGKVKIDPWTIEFSDYLSFLFQYEDIFVNRSYALPEEPGAILDLGANIGLSIFFYSKFYPNASVVGLEPDREIFALLERNIKRNDIPNVTLLNKAAWTHEACLNFQPDGADSGRVTSGKTGMEVAAVDINSLLKERKIDFLKMDVEGAEAILIPHCKLYLKEVKYIFIEFHSIPSSDQKLGTILKILEENNFIIHMKDIFTPLPPFVSKSLNHGFQFQTNIYAYKRKN